MPKPKANEPVYFHFRKSKTEKIGDWTGDLKLFEIRDAFFAGSMFIFRF
jgi:hypothetical protein